MTTTKSSPAPLDAFFTSLGVNAEATQRRLDAAHQTSLQAFLPAMASLADLGPSLAATLAPPRQLVTEMSCEVRVAVTLEQGKGTEIAVQPLGSLFERRFSTSTENAMTLAMTVVPVPLSSHPTTEEGS